MKQLLFTLTLFVGHFSTAQDTTFSKIYENTQFGESRPVVSAVTLDGGLITTSENMSGNGSVEVLRNQPDGTILWEKSYNGVVAPNGFFVNDIIATSDSCYILSGLIMDALSDYYPFCLKINDLGDVVWNKTFDFTVPTTGNYDNLLTENPYVCETSDSSVIIAWHHSTYVTSSASPDHLCVSKISSGGNLQWSSSMVVDSTFYVADLAENNDQSIFVLGNTDAQNGSGYVVHLTETGSFDWAKKYDDVVFDEIIPNANGFAVSWWDLQAQASGIMKFDSAGVNTKRIGYSGWVSEVQPSFTRRDNGNYLLSQRGDNFGGGILLELNDNLQLIGSHTVYMILQNVRNIPNYGVYVVGYGPLYGIKAVYNEVGVIRYDSLMNDDQLCSFPEQHSIYADSIIAGQPTVFTSSDSIGEFLVPISAVPTFSDVTIGCVTFFSSIDEIEGSWNETISPNPSEGEFTISWNEYRNAEIVIYNSIGKEVFRSNAKNSFVEIDLRLEQNGFYYYRLTDNEGSQSNGKLVLLK